MKLLGFLSAIVGCALLAASILFGGMFMETVGISGGFAATFFFSSVLFLGGVVFLILSFFLVRSSRKKMSQGYEIERIEGGL